MNDVLTLETVETCIQTVLEFQVAIQMPIGKKKNCKAINTLNVVFSFAFEVSISYSRVIVLKVALHLCQFSPPLFGNHV